ncbi:MAG: undecaprenyl/decaprenyl-phosphate alpha-N-acetylglucosaminyl 1-phosphate transferase [Tannerella sp.]|nr:undecaprenyl/decaprenyl-phosphate alpha-N-acetylglucosaminyl 1-phosphate transferase [Tannerella sp.]
MILAILVIPKILVIAVRHSLYDEHDDRKTHTGSVPRIGGVSFIPCIFFAMQFSIGVFYRYVDGIEYNGLYPNHSVFSFFSCGVLLIYLGGVKDDLVGLRYLHKFIIQVISSVLIVISGFYINNFYGFLGIHEITPWIGIPLTIFILIFVVNAINLIDGMDGLASSISIFALCIYGTLFLLHGIWYYAALAFSTIGVLIPFFYYNMIGSARKGRKIFMGDSGSLTLGFILGFLAVRYACYKPDFITLTGNALVIAVSPLLVPMLDVIRVMLIRIRNHKHLFKPDRNHIHHKLQDMGIRKSSALSLILSISGVLCVMNIFLLQYLNCTYIFLIDIVLWSSVNMYFSYVVRKRKRLKHNVNYP